MLFISVECFIHLQKLRRCSALPMVLYIFSKKNKYMLSVVQFFLKGFIVFYILLTKAVNGLDATAEMVHLKEFAV